MAIRFIRLLVVILLVMLTAKSALAAEWNGTLTDEAFEKFIEQYKTDPGAVLKNKDIFRKTSSRQFHKIFTELGTTHFSYMYPVEIKGEEIADLIGKNIKSLSLMAVKGGKFVPVPYQIDEFDNTGLIYIEDVSPNKPNGTPGVLDTSDELVFMFRDAGTVPYNAATMKCTQGKVLKEIRLDPPRNDPRYIYIVEGNSLRSDADYVWSDIEKLSVESSMYKVIFNPKNTLEFLECSTKVGPNYGKDFFDDYYFKMSSGLFSKHLRFELNSRDNVTGIPLGVKDGPVRVSLLFKIRIRYWGIPTMYTEYFTFSYYEQSEKVPTRFSLDSLKSLRFFLNFIKQPQMEITFDLHTMNGARFITQNAYNPDKPEEMAIIDSKMSAIEKKILSLRLPGEWLYLDSNQGWALFFSNQMHIPSGGLIDQYMDGLQVQLLYEDNLQHTLKNEKYPGVQPLIGATVEGFPNQAVKMLASLKNMNFSEIETFGELIFELDRIGEKGDLKPLDEMAKQAIAKLKKNGRIKSKEDLIKILIDDLTIFNIKGVEREKLFDIVRHAAESEISDNMNDFNYWKLIHKMIEFAEADGINLNDLKYAYGDSTIWFPDALDNNDPEDFNWQLKNPPKVNIMPYNSVGITSVRPRMK